MDVSPSNLRLDEGRCHCLPILGLHPFDKGLKGSESLRASLFSRGGTVPLWRGDQCGLIV